MRPRARPSWREARALGGGTTDSTTAESIDATWRPPYWRCRTGSGNGNRLRPLKPQLAAAALPAGPQTGQCRRTSLVPESVESDRGAGVAHAVLRRGGRAGPVSGGGTEAVGPHCQRPRRPARRVAAPEPGRPAVGPIALHPR